MSKGGWRRRGNNGSDGGWREGGREGGIEQGEGERSNDARQSESVSGGREG